MTITKRKRFYPYFDHKSGRDKVLQVTYTLYYEDTGELIDIKNELGCSVEKNSEVWEAFSS